MYSKTAQQYVPGCWSRPRSSIWKRKEKEEKKILTAVLGPRSGTGKNLNLRETVGTEEIPVSYLIVTLTTIACQSTETHPHGQQLSKTSAKDAYTNHWFPLSMKGVQEGNLAITEARRDRAESPGRLDRVLKTMKLDENAQARLHRTVAIIITPKLDGLTLNPLICKV